MESGDVSRQVTWASYNKPSQITGNGAQETFVYGPDRSRLQTAIAMGSDTVTTTYIDGLFEQVYDSSTGNLTYRHYILAGGARVGVETISANSGGTITADTLSFYVRDEVGSVIATVTESLGGANQTVALNSYDAWGKARPTSGTTAYQDPAPGTFYSPTPSGKEEGFAGHDNLSDTGLVDMEGRVYDPEVGRFLSADPNVQYPFSSQGYDRYIYVNDNPLSLSDPSGYFAGNQWLGLAAAIVVTVACEGTCTAMTTAFLAGAADGYLSSGGNLQQTGLSGLEAMAFTYVGDDVNWGDTAGDQFAKGVTESLIGGAFTQAGGGRFGDGFLVVFASFELSPMIGSIGGNPKINPAVYFSAANMAARVVVSAVVGGTVAAMTGGDFSDGAEAAAFQRLFNEEATRSILHARAEAFLRKVIRPALLAIGMDSSAAENLLLGTAIQESGLSSTTQNGGGPALGKFQMEPATAKDIMGRFLATSGHLELRDEVLSLESACEVNPSAELTINDQYAAAMARIRYMYTSVPLPAAGNISAMAEYWHSFYNTNPAISTQQFVKNWQYVMGGN